MRLPPKKLLRDMMTCIVNIKLMRQREENIQALQNHLEDCVREKYNISEPLDTVIKQEDIAILFPIHLRQLIEDHTAEVLQYFGEILGNTLLTFAINFKGICMPEEMIANVGKVDVSVPSRKGHTPITLALLSRYNNRPFIELVISELKKTRDCFDT